VAWLGLQDGDVGYFRRSRALAERVMQAIDEGEYLAGDPEAAEELKRKIHERLYPWLDELEAKYGKSSEKARDDEAA